MTPARARILLVDDEAPILKTTSEILRQQGFDVDEAADGFSALAAIEHTSYDLVLTDLKMDGMDGLELLSEVQKKSPQTATVMMTGYGTVESAIEAVRSGAYEFLMKPVSPQELKEAVHRCLERKRLSEIDTLYHVGNEIAAAEAASEVQAVVVNAVKRVLGAVNVAWISADREGNVRPEAAQEPVFTPGNLKALLSHQVVEGKGSGQEGAALIPGLANGKLVGVLYVDHGGEAFDYHASFQRFLAALARDAAMAIDRLSLIDELKQNNSTLAAANRRLQELDVLKSQFLSVATHELRTPLSIILGYNTMIEESAEERLTAEERGLLRESLVACKRLLRLVNSMLDLSQMQAGKLRLQLAPHNLADSLQAITKLFEAEAQRRGLQLRLEVAGPLPPVDVDAERIEQVIVNLVSNALKFTDTDGSVTIEAKTDESGRALEIVVRDTGIGIAPEHQAMVFDEFARVRGKSGNRPGSGLGLAIVRRIVEGHGGNVSVNSKLGQGSAFTVRLPIKQRAQNAMVA